MPRLKGRCLCLEARSRRINTVRMTPWSGSTFRGGFITFRASVSMVGAGRRRSCAVRKLDEMATAARCWASGSRHIPFPSVFSPILTRRPKMRIPLGLCLRDRAGAPIRNRSSQSREDQIAVFPGFGSCHDTLPRCSPDSHGAAGHIEHGGHDGHSAVASFGVLRTGLYSVPQLRDAPSTSDQERVLGATGILVFFRKGHAAGPARTACCCYAADRILTAAMRYCAGPHRYRSQWWHRAITGLSTRACPRHVPETAAGGETSSSRPGPAAAVLGASRPSPPRSQGRPWVRGRPASITFGRAP